MAWIDPARNVKDRIDPRIESGLSAAAGARGKIIAGIEFARAIRMSTD